LLDCPKLVKKGSKNMSLVWAKPYSTEDVDKYEIQCRVSYSTQWEVIDSNIQTESYEVTGLIPATAYTFRIRPHYERKGWENSTMCAATPLWHTEPSPPEPPVEFKLISSTSYSFTMFWKMPRCNGYAVEAYGLEYRIQGEQNKETAWTIASETIAVDFSNLMIENLQRGQIYEVRIRAKNLLGFGEYLYVRDTMRTLDYLPPLPPKCSAKASFSLTIEWTEEDTEETCYYEIQMIKLEKYTQGQELPIVEESKWKTIRSDCKEKKIVASGLSPLTWYCFRVRAFKKNGCQGCNKAKEHHSVTAFSEVSEPIQTIRRL
jgi:hypothetical protein